MTVVSINFPLFLNGTLDNKGRISVCWIYFIHFAWILKGRIYFCKKNYYKHYERLVTSSSTITTNIVFEIYDFFSINWTFPCVESKFNMHFHQKLLKTINRIICIKNAKPQIFILKKSKRELKQKFSWNLIFQTDFIPFSLHKKKYLVHILWFTQILWVETLFRKSENHCIKFLLYTWDILIPLSYRLFNVGKRIYFWLWGFCIWKSGNKFSRKIQLNLRLCKTEILMLSKSSRTIKKMFGLEAEFRNPPPNR